MDAETKNRFEYRIIKINTIRFSFSDLEEAYVNSLPDGQLKGELNVKINFDREKSTISFDIASTISDQDEPVIQHVARTVYEVKGIDQLHTAEKDSFNVPDDLIVQLYAISFSHTRALFATELSPTVFKDKYFLPVIDPTDILKAI